MVLPFPFFVVTLTLTHPQGVFRLKHATVRVSPHPFCLPSPPGYGQSAPINGHVTNLEQVRVRVRVRGRGRVGVRVRVRSVDTACTKDQP